MYVLVHKLHHYVDIGKIMFPSLQTLLCSVTNMQWQHQRIITGGDPDHFYRVLVNSY